jgi:DNA-binding LytR/AlgR family response regulator
VFPLCIEFERKKESDIKNFLKIKRIVAKRNHVEIYETKWELMKRNVNLNYMEKRLPDTRFLRYDKSNIINMREVRNTVIRNGIIVMYLKKTGQALIVARRREKKFSKIIRYFPHLKPKPVM